MTGHIAATASIDSTRLRRGFTLIEVLVVLGIIVLLVAIAFPMLGKVMANGKRARTQADMGVISTALEEYKKDHGGQYPSAEGINTGFCVLARELVGVYGDGVTGTANPPAPDPNDPPAAVPNQTYRPGDCVGGGSGPNFCAMVETSTAPAQGTSWVSFNPHDGLDGPGTMVNGRKVSYIPPDRLHVRGCAILDQQDRPILYFRARGNPNINKPIGAGPSFVGLSVAPATTSAKFDAADNIQFFARPDDSTAANTNNSPALKRIRALLGDFDAGVGVGNPSFNGIIDGGETAAYNGPYLLWAAGPDGFYGPNVTEANIGDASKIKQAIVKCDDIVLTP